MTATPGWLAYLEAALNRNLLESALASAEARRLEGRSLAVEVNSIVRLRALIQHGRLLLSTDPGSDADAVICGSAYALVNLSSPSANHPSGIGAAHVHGDADVASRFRHLLHLLKPDLEFELARLIGDVPSRGLARIASAAAAWGRRSLVSARANIGEYLEEESRDLVNKTELSEFLTGVDEVRETTDRIEARLIRIERRAGGT